MKNLLFIAMLLLLTFCKDSVTETEKEKPGSLIIELNKTNIPDNIVTVKATVTRNNFEDIVKELDLLTENTADILIDELVAGTWHIILEAFDSNQKVLFAGESDFDIFPGEISPLSIELIPVIENLGGIYIYVNWDNFSYNWFDHPANPILQKDGSIYDNLGIGEPIVLYENNIYKMWYSGLVAGGRTYVFYATSTDGLNWNKYSNHPVITPGQNSWDDGHVEPGPVIKISGMYYMYYTGFSNQNSQWGIGLATSFDGITWQKKIEPILIDYSGWDYQKVATSILYVNSKYYLFYAGKNLPSNDWRISTAVSTDGISFEKASINYSLAPTKSWEGSFTGYPSVIFENNLFKMIYHSEGGFGTAYSSDGINWTKFLNEPFFTSNKSNSSPNKIAYPNVIKTDTEYKLYYTGYTQDGIIFISVARKFITNY